MRKLVAAVSLLVLSLAQFAVAQSETTLPRLIRFSARVAPGEPRLVGITFSLYKEEQGGEPLWSEVQNVRVDAEGRFAVLLGSQSAEGVPTDLFVTTEARWVGMRVENRDVERRILLVSVPYALKAGDAETLGGKPLSSFVLSEADTDSGGSTTRTSSSTTATAASSSTETPQAGAFTATTDGGTANFLAKWTDSTTLASSIISEASGNVGINTTTPNGLGTNITTINSVGSAGSGFRFGETGGSGGDSTVYTVGGNMFIGTISAHPLAIQTSNVPRIFITSLGSIGIGTTVPATIGAGITTVDMRGANGGGFRITDASANATDAIMYGTGGNVFLGSVSAHPLNIQTGNVARMRVTPGGDVGIGTLAPNAKLDIAGNARATTASSATEFSAAVPPPSGVRGDASATGQLVAAAGVLGTSTAGGGAGVFGQNNSTSGFAVGTFGISTQSVDGTGLYGLAQSSTGDAVGVYGVSKSSAGTGLFGLAEATTGDAVGVYGLSNASGGTGVWGEVSATTGANWGVLGRVRSPDTNAAGGIFDYTGTGTGNILIGRNGTTKVFRVSSTGQGFFNGGTQTSGADFAESVEIEGTKEMYSPGDVLVIDPSGSRRVALAQEPYSRLVAGIYSTKPGILATPRHMDDARIAKFEVPLAIVGIVPTKVTTENGPIRPGDLLVSSSIPGHAMKGTDPAKMMGAVVGKALQSLDKGEGVIEVLVTLQ